MSGTPNDDIIAILEQLYLHAKNDTSDSSKFRQKAFREAIDSLSKYPTRIADAAEAVKIHGIGTGIAKRIDEIRKTGQLQEYEDIKKYYPNLDAVLTEFRRIHSVGPRTAMKWYNMGYRSISELPIDGVLRIQQTPGTEPLVLTEIQKIAIRYLADTEQRIPREEIDYFNTQLRQYLDAYEKYMATQGVEIKVEYQICGSYLRGLPTSGDIDILVNVGKYPPADIMNAILSFPMWRFSLARGQKKFEGLALIRNTHRRVDVELSPPEEYPLCLCYFTGPHRFNPMMREHCKKYGYQLNEQSLISPSGFPVYVRDEHHLFEILGIPYLTPQEREAYAK